MKPESKMPSGNTSACVDGGPGSMLCENTRHVSFDFEAVDDALELAEPGELAPFLTAHEVRSWQVRRAALLAILNIETRSFNEIAAELGVKRQSISKVYTQLCVRLGFEPAFRRAETRMKNAEAALRRWHKDSAA